MATNLAIFNVNLATFFSKHLVTLSPSSLKYFYLIFNITGENLKGVLGRNKFLAINTIYRGALKFHLYFIPLRAKRVGEFIEIRTEKYWVPLGVCDSVTLWPINPNYLSSLPWDWAK